MLYSDPQFGHYYISILDGYYILFNYRIVVSYFLLIYLQINMQFYWINFIQFDKSFLFDIKVIYIIHWRIFYNKISKYLLLMSLSYFLSQPLFRRKIRNHPKPIISTKIEIVCMRLCPLNFAILFDISKMSLKKIQ